MKKKAIITFDYEVFLGNRTGTIENCVIKPTAYVLEILRKNNATAIFFIDTTWLLFLNENFLEDFKLVSKQLKNIIEAGSSIELHLHPQWLDAYKKGNKIEFKSFEKYRLHSLTQKKIIDLFKESIHLLEGITSQKVKCFRAGGFCIEPFAQIKNAFEELGILYDFSVAPGMLQKGGNIYDYNFSDAPNLPYYHFQNDVKIPEPNGLFVEVPLSTYLNNPIYRLINKLQLKFVNDQIFGDGKGIQETSNFFYTSISRRLRFSKSFLTLDKTSNSFFKFLINFHFRKSQFLVIISHPKTLSIQGLLNLSYISKRFNTLNTTDIVKLLLK